MTIHRHALPITGNDPITGNGVFATVAGRNYLISHATTARSQVDVAEKQGQTLWFDPGAFTYRRRLLESIKARRAGGEFISADDEHELLHAPRDWRPYYEWCDERLDRPTTMAIIPDVIDAASQLQDALIKEWPFGRKGVPVYHIHHSEERLLRLLDEWEWVALGSSGEYWDILSDEWCARMDFLWNEIPKRHRRTPNTHMLRGMQLALDPHPYPFASLDSSDVGQNHNRPQNTARAMVDRWDAAQCPARWVPPPVQLNLLERAA